METYEYLVKYNGNVGNDINTEQRIVIVQDNGHLININKPSEYVTTQDQNTKQFESVACPMIDVSQQPLYFQLNSSSELIPISVNSIPTIEPTNVFENTYLLPNLTVEVIQPENNVPNKHNAYSTNLQEESENMDVDANKLPGGYAEITLNDEQCEILKHKGWILLEIKDKVFLLDSSGLHEITDDHELVAKLKHETSQIIDKNSQTTGSAMKIVMIPGNANTNVVAKHDVYDQTESMEIGSRIESIQQEEEIIQQDTQDQMVTAIPSTPLRVTQTHDNLNDDTNETFQTKNNTKIHIKTQYQFKDIPKEIVLGKTVNGKNLIARVVKGKSFFKNAAITNKNIKSEVERDRNINDKQFAKLVQQVLLGTADNCRVEDIASVETVMKQMFRVADLKPDLRKHKLIVTKTIREENEDGLIENQTEPAVVTGRFIKNGNEEIFVHIPDMLRQHMKNSELEKSRQNCDNENDKNGTGILENDMFLHVNITETKDVNNTSRASVLVYKRYLSLSQVYNMKTKHIYAVYACTACARIFKTQEELADHQEYQCAESPGEMLSCENPQPYSIIKTHNEMKVYLCNECKATFANIKNCQEHLRTHHKKHEQAAAIDAKHQSSDRKQSEVFKCKMCENTYYHSSSLTKHILAKHIKSK